MAAPANEILEKAFDESTDRLKVQVEGSVDLDAGDIQIGAVEIKDGTTDARAPVSATNGVAVDNKTLAPGSATAANQATEISSLASIDGKVTPTASTASHANVVSANVDTLLLAANANRKAAFFFNDADKTLYLKYGSGASATSHVLQIAAGGFYELPRPVFTGLIHGFWAAGPTGSARVTELS